jgi:hypothetical protein
MAEEVQFTIDPARSSVLAFGTLAANEARAQLPGSDIASFSGVFKVDLTASTIQFLDGSFADVIPFPLPLQPGANGELGSGPADYGFESGPDGFGTTRAALRDFIFTFNSAVLPLRQNGSLLQFNESVQQGVQSGRVEFHNGTTNGAKSWAGFSIPVDDDNVASLRTENGVQTLQFHFYSGIGFDARQDSDSLFQFSGDLVATRAVPEPGAVGMVLVGAFLIVRRGRQTFGARWVRSVKK